MANVRAIKSGNWSDPTVWNTGALPTTADDVYANTFTVTIDQNITVLTLRTTSATGISAGGGFVISTSVTVTCTNSIGIQPGTTTAVTVSANSPAIVTINSNLTNSPTTDTTNVILKSGTCTLNINGSTLFGGFGSNRHCLNVNTGGTINFVGNVRGFWGSSRGILMNTNSTGAVLNIVGNINPDRLLNSPQNENPLVILSICTVNITGNVYGDLGNSVAVTISAAATVYITGIVYGGQGAAGVSTSAAVYLNIVGIIDAEYIGNVESVAVVSTSTSAINLFTGPFICSAYGRFPLSVFRMHLIPTLNNYIEFRDDSTNGALSPGAIAPTTRLVSPDTIIDAPTANNVRSGVSYGNGAYTGTCVIPSSSNVSLNVPFDTNSVGTAYISATDIAEIGDTIWDKPISELNTVGSIGERLKNASTVDITGAQIAGLL